MTRRRGNSGNVAAWLVRADGSAFAAGYLGGAHPYPKYYFARSGRGQVWSGGVTPPIRAGDFFQIPVGARRTIVRLGGDIELLYLAVK